MPSGGVSCPKPGSCVVSGLDYGAGLENGAWRLVRMDELKRVTHELVDVDCSSPRWCMAVGSKGNQFWPGAQVYRDGKWAVTDSSKHEWFYAGVDCPRRNWCIAVGEAEKAKDIVLSRWNGKKWERMTPPEMAPV